jgi:hypothetical protein
VTENINEDEEEVDEEMEAIAYVWIGHQAPKMAKLRFEFQFAFFIILQSSLLVMLIEFEPLLFDS